MIPDAAPPADASPHAPYCTPRAGTSLRLTPVREDLTLPVALAAPPGDPRLFVVEQRGAIRVIAADGSLSPDPFLSIAVTTTGGEQGLLGLAFHPRFATNGRFFVFYVGADDALRIAEYHADPDAAVADPAETLLLEIPHPTARNHNGGTLAFGPDGYLYASVGDGALDPTNAQRPDVHLGKLLRLDVDGGAPYAIPPDNPWAGGDAGVPEMYAWGLRNPWRFGIDEHTGDVWIADVGAGSWEEIDVVRASRAGRNHGWPVFEGAMCFNPSAGGEAGCGQPERFAGPVLVYERVGGPCAIIGGAVYRGGCMPDLHGRFFFGDLCTGEVRSLDVTQDAVALGATIDHTLDLDPEPRRLFMQLAAFGVDGFGELYVLTRQGRSVYRVELE